MGQTLHVQVRSQNVGALNIATDYVTIFTLILMYRVLYLAHLFRLQK